MLKVSAESCADLSVLRWAINEVVERQQSPHTRGRDGVYDTGRPHTNEHGTQSDGAYNNGAYNNEAYNNEDKPRDAEKVSSEPLYPI